MPSARHDHIRILRNISLRNIPHPTALRDRLRSEYRGLGIRKHPSLVCGRHRRETAPLQQRHAPQTQVTDGGVRTTYLLGRCSPVYYHNRSPPCSVALQAVKKAYDGSYRQ